jgi:hypothetical protein
MCIAVLLLVHTIFLDLSAAFYPQGAFAIGRVGIFTVLIDVSCSSLLVILGAFTVYGQLLRFPTIIALCW